MIFEKASFEPNDFRSAVVDGKILFIYLHSMTEPLHMDFKSGSDAQAALIRLDAEVAANRTVKVGDSAARSNTVESKPSIFACFDKLVQKGKDKVDNIVNGTSAEALLFQMATDQASKAIKAKAEELTQNLEEVLGTVTAAVAKKGAELKDEAAWTFDELKEVIAAMQEVVLEDEKDEKEEPAKEGTKTSGAGWSRHMTAKKTNIVQEDVFNGGASTDDLEEIAPGSVGAPDEPLIGDLTAPELHALIDEFVEGAMNNPMTQEVFGNIYQIFGKKEADEAISNLKNIIFEMAITQPNSKLSDVLQRFLR